jgi:serine/threonine-protein kinase
MLVHQDVNSFNVMISYEAEVKIIDFGIARIFLDKATSNGLPITGKLLYFSPEQLLRKNLDRRVDIYGTGVLLYELLTGERLVKHQETIPQTVKTILEMDILSKVREHDRIPEHLKPVLVRAMASDRNKRYSWMEELIDAL